MSERKHLALRSPANATQQTRASANAERPATLQIEFTTRIIPKNSPKKENISSQGPHNAHRCPNRDLDVLSCTHHMSSRSFSDILRAHIPHLPRVIDFRSPHATDLKPETESQLETSPNTQVPSAPDSAAYATASNSEPKTRNSDPETAAVSAADCASADTPYVGKDTTNCSETLNVFNPKTARRTPLSAHNSGPETRNAKQQPFQQLIVHPTPPST